MAFQIFDVVKVPFPFTDLNVSKRRPAVVVSDFDYYNVSSDHVVLVMITSANSSSFPLDIKIKDSQRAGLKKRECLMRVGKIFTLDSRFVESKLGKLSLGDQKTLKMNLKKLFHL